MDTRARKGGRVTVVDIETRRTASVVQFVSAGELTRAPKPTDWLIRKVLQRDSMNTIIGAPGSFKSNLATIDMAASVATGTPWHGRATKQGAVFVIAGEGHSGIGKRLKAWSIVRGIDLDNAPLFVSMGAVGLVEPLTAAAVSEEVEKLANQTGLRPALVIVDTLARNFGPGDENSAGDMGRFIMNLDVHIRQRFKCAVVIVHHTGVGDSSRARGSSALFAAVDAELICERKDQEKALTVRCRKQKDGSEFEPIFFEARVVELPWPGDDNLPETSFALFEASSEDFSELRTTAKFGSNERKAYDTLQALYEEHRARLTQAGQDPSSALVRIDEWRQRSGIDARRYPEVRAGLEKRNLIRIEHPHVVLL